MNVSQITHIFWKEYRTQRSIWLRMIALIAIVQMLVWYYMPENALAPFVTMAYSGAILSVFYALASAGVLFAGEREDQTHEWLRILPVTRASLFGGKLLWLIVSWLTILVLTILVAALPYGGTSWNSVRFTDLVLQFLLYGSNFMLWSLLFSLSCRRIYSVLALASLGFVVTTSVDSNAPGTVHAFDLLLVASIVVQGQRWLMTDQLLPTIGLRERTGTFDLNTAVSLPVSASPGWQMFCRELWLEWQHAKWTALTLAVLVCSAEILEFGGGIVFWSMFVPFGLGLMTFRSEHRQDRYRFQSNIGVTPLMVWTSKHVVWGGLLLVGAGLTWLSFFSSLYDEAGATRLSHVTGSLLVQPLMLPSYLKSSWYHSLGPTLILASAWSCWLYSVGHVCSVLLKRSISAALVGIMLAFLVGFLTVVSLMFDVPRSIAMFFPATCLMGFSLWRSHGIISERNESRDWRRVAGVLTLLALACCSSWVMWRLKEITLPPLFAGIVALLPLAGVLQISFAGGIVFFLILLAVAWAARRYLTSQRVFVIWAMSHVVCAVLFTAVMVARSQDELAALPLRVESEDSHIPVTETYRQYRDLLSQLQGKLPQVQEESGQYVTMQAVYRGDVEVSDEQWAWLDANQEVLAQLIAVKSQLAPATDNGYDDHRIADLLRLSSMRAEQSGDLAKAWEFQRELLKLQRELLQNQVQPARGSMLRHLLYYYDVELKRWVNHPNQSPEFLLQAALDYRDILGNAFTLQQAVRLKYQQQHTALADDTQGHWGANSEIYHSFYKIPWEQARSQLVFQRVTEHQLEIAKDLEAGRMWALYEEINSRADLWRTNHYVKEFGVPLAWYPGHETLGTANDSDRLWKLAETSPLFYPDEIENFGSPPERGEDDLIQELAWLRHQRLFLLNAAFRAAELETGHRPKSLQELAAQRENPAVHPILTVGEEWSGTVWNYEANIYTHKEYRDWHHRLYYDPISDELFQISTIDEWRN